MILALIFTVCLEFAAVDSKDPCFKGLQEDDRRRPTEHTGGGCGGGEEQMTFSQLLLHFRPMQAGTADRVVPSPLEFQLRWPMISLDPEAT